MSRTIRVRIAVAATPDGEWSSCGWGRADGTRQPSDEEKMGLAVDTLEDGESRFWIEADITIPDPQVIEVEAVPAPTPEQQSRDP